MTTGGEFGRFVAGGARASLRAAGATALIVSILASGLVAAAGSAGADTAQPKSIDDYLTMPGDQVVTVPDGTYTGGEVTAPHAATSGRYGGWLILVAQDRGGAIVDLANAPSRQLWLHAGSSHIAFIGFSFRNGIIRNEAQFTRFWYCDHQDPDYDYLNAKRETPRMFQTYNAGDDLEVYGSDFHNGVATPVFFGSLVDNVTIQGVRIYDIDPKFGDVLDPLSHIVPMGSPPGAHQQIRILNSYLEGYYTLWGTDEGSDADLTWQNIWYGFGYASPFLLQAVPGNKIERATRVNWQIFGPSADSSKNGNDPYIYVDGAHYSGPAAFQHKDRIDLTDTNVEYGYPTGVSDPVSAQNSPQNPATLWRDAHPYESWRSFFAWPAPPKSNHLVLVAAGGVVAICIAAAFGQAFFRRRRRRAHPRGGSPSGAESDHARGVGSYG